MANANRGFFCGVASPLGISVDGVIGLWKPLKILVFIHRFVVFRILIHLELAHIKDRFGHDILLAGPVAQVALAAARAAKREVRVDFGVGRRFANRASMFHRGPSPLALSYEIRSLQPSASGVDLCFYKPKSLRSEDPPCSSI